ncbi:MAG TPA: hypothetical protein PLS49_00355 [Candidatus Woesebacteria bacterium]|nr:hypothetical protein [Candidatus Woesebacteria bacterium]
MFWFYLIYILLLLPALAESIFYPGIIKNYLGIEDTLFIICAFILSCYIRISVKKNILQNLRTILFFWLAPIITVSAIVMRALELAIHPNFIYSLIHIDPTQFSIFGFFLYCVSIPFVIDKVFLMKEYKKNIIQLSLFAYHIIFLYWINPFLYHEIQKEDGIVEYTTFLTFLIGSICSFLSLRYINKLSLTKLQQYIFKCIVLCVCIGLFVIAAEEISWGQRITNIQTPDSLKDVNTQGELTIHNNVAVFHYVYIGYLIVNLYGLLSWISFDLFHKKLKGVWLPIFRFITTRWYLMLFFIPNLVYVILRLTYGNAIIDESEELTELYLSSGLMIWMYLNLIYLKKLAQFDLIKRK